MSRLNEYLEIVKDPEKKEKNIEEKFEKYLKQAQIEYKKNINGTTTYGSGTTYIIKLENSIYPDIKSIKVIFDYSIDALNIKADGKITISPNQDGRSQKVNTLEQLIDAIEDAINTFTK